MHTNSTTMMDKYAGQLNIARSPKSVEISAMVEPLSMTFFKSPKQWLKRILNLK